MEQANQRVHNAILNGDSILDLSNLELKSLPKIPDNIETLILNNNKLSELPLLPEKLTDLYVDNNELTEIDLLPKGLEFISCRNNRILFFTEIPDSLKFLDCRYNLLYNEPEVPKNCKLFVHPSSKYHKKLFSTVEKSNSKSISQIPLESKELIIPPNTENALVYEEIKNGNTIVDFENESKFNRYYLKSTYDSLMEKGGINPFTKNPIKNGKTYTAKINSTLKQNKQGGKRVSLKNKKY